jgi:glycosyltransferase involved in cell wall biosynthesis
MTRLHVISFDVPYPANYGGVIDVYHKLRCLHAAGIKIHLHCFTYGRGPATELEALCEQVYYYPRQTGILSNLSLLPYTVKSRQSAELRQNLLRQPFPILFEVLHTCDLLNDPELATRKKIFRHSNIEHDYYHELSKGERNWIKRWYLKVEAFKLRRFENVLAKADYILAVNQKDTLYYAQKFSKVKSIYLPSFHAQDEVMITQGNGDYILYHGNLSISENYVALQWLLKEVFAGISVPVVIAGLNPPEFLKQEIKQYAHVKLIENPSEKEMDTLIKEAQVHVLYTMQGTGLKLKLLNVLFRGRFVVLNGKMLEGTGLKADDTLFCTETAACFKEQIQALMQKKFANNEVMQRSKQLKPFMNQTNIKTLLEIIQDPAK